MIAIYSKRLRKMHTQIESIHYKLELRNELDIFFIKLTGNYHPNTS